MDEKIIDVDVDKIDIIENSRVRTDLSDVSGLMRDIKDNGLLHPIGVYKKYGRYALVYGSRRLMAYKKLGYREIPCRVWDTLSDIDQIILNTSENIRREDLRPFELGRICSILFGQGLNKNEIAARLGISLPRVTDLMEIYRKVPKDMQHLIENVKSTRNPEGRLSTFVVSSIVQNRELKQKDKDSLMRYAKRNSLTASQVSIIGGLVKNGLTLKEAIDKMQDSVSSGVKFTFKKKELNEFLSENKLSLQRYCYEVLKGERKPNPSILA